MSPALIKLLFHIHTTTEPLPYPSSTMRDASVEFFVREKLIVADNSPLGYRTTERGKALVDHLCAVKLPICQWVQPQ